MIVRLTVVTTLIALFALSFSALVESSRQRSLAAPATGECSASAIFCAPGTASRA